MRLRNILAAATCATCLTLPFTSSIAAHAQPVTGPYVSLGAGTSIVTPVGSSSSSFDDSYSSGEYVYKGTDETPFKALFAPSLSGEVSAGYGFGNGFRVELAGNFDRSTIRKTDFSGAYYYQTSYSYEGRTEGTNSGGSTDDPYSEKATGGEDRYGVMANVLYDFSVGLPVYPFVGAGAGYQWTHDKLSEYNPWDDVTETYKGTPGSFAYNIIAGLSYPVDAVPGLSVTAEYRYMQLVQNRKLHTTFNYSFEDGYTISNEQKNGQESEHTFLLGLRYALFPPAAAVVATTQTTVAPPVEAPAAPPPRTFIVFFDWDKYSLTTRATEIIAEAASDSKTANVTTLNVSGYTDTSGTADYNMGLSQRRAEAVAAKLEADGVPASEIEIHAYGETHLLVQTGPGVREPQNRRVEIILG